MFYAIINTENDVLKRYETLEEAESELMFYNDEYAVVDYYDYFHSVPANLIQERIESVTFWLTANLHEALNLVESLQECGLTLEQIF